MLQAVQLPARITNLDSGLANVDGDDFPHDDDDLSDDLSDDVSDDLSDDLSDSDARLTLCEVPT